MTRATFHAFLIHPSTGPTLDRMIADNARADAARLASIQSKLTPRELAYCVELLGKGRTLEQALDTIQAQRPTLPFTPEAA